MCGYGRYIAQVGFRSAPDSASGNRHKATVIRYREFGEFVSGEANCIGYTRAMTSASVDGVDIGGFVAPGFEPVEEEFARNFEKRGEIGAAVCVYHRGDKVVDLWGGVRDAKTGELWREDTMMLAFSTTKGMAAVAVAVAHSRGYLDLDERVATYWPEFAQHGKDRVTVRQLLSHQAGLPAIDEPLTIEKLADLDRMAEILANQKPAWEPGQEHGYHGLSLGWYEGELIRRVDPKKRSLGPFFRDEVAKPLDVEFYIGLPDDIPPERVGAIRGFHPAEMLLHINTMPWRFVLGILNPWSLTARTFFNPKFSRPESVDGPEYRRLEMPAINGIGQARAVARIYSDLACGGEELGLGEATIAALHQPADTPPRGSFDRVLKTDTAFSLGFLKPFPRMPFASSERGFGTPGAGGSFGFADPDAQIGFCYLMNRMGFYMMDDPREQALREAVYQSIAA